MTPSDPLSLTQAKRLASNADTLLLRATRAADLETPIGAFLRLDDGTTPAYLLESVEGGERLGRYSFLGIGPRKLLEVRDGQARDPGPPGHASTGTTRSCRSAPRTRPTRSQALRSFVGRRRVEPTEDMPRFTGGAVGALAYDAVSIFEPTVPTAGGRPGRNADGGVHRDRPRPRLRPPDPHAVGDRVAPHRRAGPRGPLPDRRGGDLRGARADRPAVGGRDAAPASAPGDAPTGITNGTMRRPARRPQADASLGRDEYVHAVEVAKDAIAAGEAIQVVLARRQSFDLPTDPATGKAARRHRPVSQPSPRQPEPVPVLRPRARVRGRRRQPGAARPARRRQAHHPSDCRHAPPWRHARRGRDPRRAAPARPEGARRARDARRPRPQRPRAGVAAGHGDRQQVHGRRALLRTSCTSCRHVEGRLRPDLDALDALRAVFPAGTLSRRPEGPRDAAHRGRGERAAGPVRRRGRLPRLRRQPRHRDHDPERRPARGPGARPHGRGNRRGLRAGEGVRGDRAQGRGAPAGDRGGRRSRSTTRGPSSAEPRPAPGRTAA